TRPCRRTARAAPVPAAGRAVALSALTFVMDRSLLILVDRNANGRKRGRCCGRPKRLRPAGRAAYSRICPETQEIRRIASPAIGPGTVLALLPPPLAGEGWGGGPLPTRFARRPRIDAGAGSSPPAGAVKLTSCYS